jgi:signal transduction histidine kinase
VTIGAKPTRERSWETEHADRLAALGQAVSSVAHELNNPLTTIINWSERLQSTPLDHQSQQGLEVILGEAQRAARLVRNLLSFAQKRPTTRTLADVNSIVCDTLALRAHEQRSQQITVTTQLAEELPKVFVDGQQIQQVLLNLTINAEQAMTAAHGQGSLVVRTRHAAERRAVIIEVADDGPGIPAAVRNRIFDPFYTTKASGSGTGLGLTIARSILTDHGGHIRVESAATGTSFIIDLPVSVAETS